MLIQLNPAYSTWPTIWLKIICLVIIALAAILGHIQGLEQFFDPRTLTAGKYR